MFTIFAIVLLSVASVSAQQQYNCPIGSGIIYGLYGGYGSGMMLLSWVTYILLIVLIIATIYWLIKSANKKE